MPAELAERLADRRVAARLVVADEIVAEAPHASDSAGAWADLREQDTVIARTRNRFALALLQAAELRSSRVLTPWATIAAVRDKPRAAQILAAQGLPTPRTYLAATPAALASLPQRRFPLILKPHAGDNGRGVVIVDRPDALARCEWTDSMVLAQEYIECGGVDLKVYAVGNDVWAVRRASPLLEPVRRARHGVELIEPTTGLRDLAESCGRAFGLTLFGVDIVESQRGPLIVDVNEFPNYTGISEAPDAIADAVIRRHSRTEAA